MKLSIVTTLYKSAPYIHEFYSRSSLVASKLFGDDFEFIFVNDGSPDNSLEVVKKIADSDSKIKVINLSRNFGHHNAILAGLEESKGELVYLIDIDLEEQPEWLELFYNELIKGADVVYGSQASKRKGGLVERLFGWIFWLLFFKLSKLPPQKSPVIARLMTRNYLKGLLSYSETNFFFGGLSAHAGYNQVPYEVDKKDKKSTTYSFVRRATLAINAIVAFSGMPLLILSVIGFFMATAGSIMFLDILFQKITGKNILAGWSSIMASIWFLFGVLTTSVSVVGLYIVKIYEEVKRRPRYLVKDVYQKNVNK